MRCKPINALALIVLGVNLTFAVTRRVIDFEEHHVKSEYSGRIRGSRIRRDAGLNRDLSDGRNASAPVIPEEFAKNESDASVNVWYHNLRVRLFDTKIRN